MTDALERYKSYLETLTPETLTHLQDYVSEDVHFRDPFHDGTGVDHLRRVFEAMFDSIENIRFDVDHCLGDARCGMLAWRFAGQVRGRPLSFDGTSVLAFDEHGRVLSHIDHWDAAAAVYQKIPLIGPVLRWCQRRIATASERV